MIWKKIKSLMFNFEIPYFADDKEFNIFFNKLKDYEKFYLKKYLCKPSLFWQWDNFCLIKNFNYQSKKELKTILTKVRYNYLVNLENNAFKTSFFAMFISKTSPLFQQLEQEYQESKIEEKIKYAKLKLENKNQLINNLITQKNIIKNNYSFLSKYQLNLRKKIFEVFKTVDYQKIVKLNEYLRRKEELKKDYFTKKISIKSKNFKVFASLCYKFMQRINNKFTYRISLNILKKEFHITKKIIRNKKILIDQNGDYHFLNEFNNHDYHSVNMKQQIVIVKNEYKEKYKQFKAAIKNLSIFNKIKKQIKFFRLNKTQVKKQLYELKKDTSWNANLKYKIYRYKLEYFQEYYLALDLLEEKKNKYHKQYLNLKQNKILIWFFLKQQLVAWKTYFFEIREYKKSLSLQTTKISRKSKSEAVYFFKKNWKQKYYSLIYDNELSKVKHELNFINYEIKRYKQNNRLVLNSTISEMYASTPIYRYKICKYFSGLLGFFLPGVGQIYNRQFIKGIVMLILIPVLILFLMYVCGIGTTEGEGLWGLIGLGKDKYDNSGLNIPNSNYFLIEGCIAIILLVFSVCIMFASGRDAYLNGLALEKGARCRNWLQTKKFLTTQGYPYLATFPSFIFIVFITFLPIFSSFLIAFTNYSSSNQPGQVILKWDFAMQFKEIFSKQNSQMFSSVLVWTVIWTICTSCLSILVGFFYAFLMNNKRIKFKGLFRLIFLIPWAIPAFISILFFFKLFSAGGTLNILFHFKTSFINNPFLAKLILLLVNTWLYNTNMFLMATGLMQSISPELYEAAKIDGSSSFKQIFKITLPLVLSAMAPILVTAFVGGFNSFAIIFMMTNGGPEFLNPGVAGQTDTIVSLIFKLVNTHDVGMASAFNILIVLFLILVPGFIISKTKTVKGDAL